MYGHSASKGCRRLGNMRQKAVSASALILFVPSLFPCRFPKADACCQSADGRFTSSGHENGSIYIFNNDTGRLTHSLAGLVHPIRSVSFSPASKLLAAGGDAKIIALYDVMSGEQVANFTGHGGWVLSLDWSDTGEYLLSGYVRFSSPIFLIHYNIFKKSLSMEDDSAVLTV